MGREFEMYDVEAITLFRNDSRILSFNQILQELQGRAQTLEKTPHWILSPDDVVISCFFLKFLPLYVSTFPF